MGAIQRGTSWATIPKTLNHARTVRQRPLGVAWVVRDSLWNASCASAQRRKQLLKSWAERTLQVSSIDMSFAPPLVVAHMVYNMSNWHWVLRLLLIAPTREYLYLKFDQMCGRPHIVGANR